MKAYESKLLLIYYLGKFLCPKQGEVLHKITTSLK